jgi:hypothetical protein
MNSRGTDDFSQIFRTQLYELVEFSLAADAQLMGTLIFGNSQNFVYDSVRYGSYLVNNTHWQQSILTVLQKTSPSSFLFKVDWKNNVANKATFYFRYMNGIDETLIFNLLLSGENEEIKNYLGTLSKKYSVGFPVSVGIRTSADNSLPVSFYYDVNRTKAADVEKLVSEVAEMMQWPSEAITRMQLKLQFMNKMGHPQYIAFSASDKAIKINFPHVSIENFSQSMDIFNTDIYRKNEMKLLCRQWKQSHLNYLGIKFNQTECGWKAYLVISQQHSGNHLHYNLKL